MKPIYENIDVAMDTSFKVAVYTHNKSCESTHWHIHPEYELVYIKNGSGLLHIENKKVPYSNGALLFIGPNMPHADFGNKEFPDNLEVVIQFGKEFVEEKLPIFPEFKTLKKMILSSSKILIFNDTAKEALASAFEHFDTSTGPKRLVNFMGILERLSTSQAHTLLPSATTTANKAIEVNRLEAVFEYVNENYGENISSQTLGSYLGLTTNSFCRFFKKMTRRSFIQFLNEFRVRMALDLLDENLYSISEVMYKCGFNDASYFSKQFKKHQGTTPTDYLQRGD